MRRPKISTGISLTKQSMKDECDINKIMEKYQNGGEINHINKAQGQYGDFASGLDFTQAYTAIAKAEASFATLPAYIRDKFGNNPETFLYKMEDPEFIKELEKDGVYDPEVGPITEEPKSAPVLDTITAPGNPEVPGPASTGPNIMGEPSRPT